MVDTKALMKTFGAGANVIGQIATDKAVNARRRTVSSFDFSQGTFLDPGPCEAGQFWVDSGLGRNATGGFVVRGQPGVEVKVIEASGTRLKLYSSSALAPGLVLLWVV